MSLTNIKNIQKDRGFTIVELLIVIVVIGILAAITIVAYNGVQNRAKTASAQSLANTIAKKAEAYNAIKSGYPADGAAFNACRLHQQNQSWMIRERSTTISAPTDEKMVHYGHFAALLAQALRTKTFLLARK